MRWAPPMFGARPDPFFLTSESSNHASRKHTVSHLISLYLILVYF